jgi:hypothetical protein
MRKVGLRKIGPENDNSGYLAEHAQSGNGRIGHLATLQTHHDDSFAQGGGKERTMQQID